MFSLILSYIFLTALVVNSSFLSYKYAQFYYSGNMLEAMSCADGCDSVMMSEYGTFYGIPTPFFGLVAFLLLALLFYFRTNYQNKHFVIAFYVFLGICCLVALALLYILHFELDMFCKFCVLSHVTLFLFAGLQLLRDA